MGETLLCGLPLCPGHMLDSKAKDPFTGLTHHSNPNLSPHLAQDPFSTVDYFPSILLLHPSGPRSGPQKALLLLPASLGCPCPLALAGIIQWEALKMMEREERGEVKAFVS